MYLHTYRFTVDFFLMLNSTSLGFEPEFFSLHCQRCNHLAMEVLYRLSLYVLNILALLRHEDDSTILYKTKSLDGTSLIVTLKLTNTNTNPNPILIQILTVFSSVGGVVTQCMPENN